MAPSSATGSCYEAASFWSPLLAGQLKLNTDAAVFPSLGKTGFGFVLRDHEQCIMECCAGAYEGLLDPLSAELIGIKEALAWLHDNNLDNVIVETDSQLASLTVNHRSSFACTSSLIVEDIISSLSVFLAVSITFVRRSTNLIAHELARASGLELGKSFWGCNPPNFLLVAIAADSASH